MPRNKRTKAQSTPPAAPARATGAEIAHVDPVPAIAAAVKPAPFDTAAKMRMKMRLLLAQFKPSMDRTKPSVPKAKRGNAPSPKTEGGRLISAKKRALIEQRVHGLGGLYGADIESECDAPARMYCDLVIYFKGQRVTAIRLLEVNKRDCQSIRQQQRARAEFGRRSAALRACLRRAVGG